MYLLYMEEDIPAASHACDLAANGTIDLGEN